MMKSAKLPQTVKTLSDGREGASAVCVFHCSIGVRHRKSEVCCLKWAFVVFPAVEDQKELASPVSPELRQKEVQMNFLNQLTSVFNPRVSSSPSITVETQVKNLKNRNSLNFNINNPLQGRTEGSEWYFLIQV